MLRVKRGEVRFHPECESNGSYLYQGEPFTGIAYTVAQNGQVESEQEFRNGLRWGYVWERFQSGVMYHEATFYRDVLHGRAREWHENGQLAKEGEYEYGIALWEKKWDESATLVEDYHLRKTDSNYGLLQTFRRAYGDANDGNRDPDSGERKL